MKPRVFLDTSALFTALWSEAGGGRMILKLGEAGAVQIEVSPQVLAEMDGVLRRKYPQGLAVLALILDHAQVRVAEAAPDQELIDQCLELTHHPGDARILADAWSLEPDYLVTLDREHFLDNENLCAAVPFVIGTPGDFLAWLRVHLLGRSPSA